MFNEVYRFGPFQMDPVRRTLQRNGVPVKLRPKEWQLLLTLVECAPNMAKREKLNERGWGKPLVNDQNLASTMFRLRKALDPPPSGGAYIANIPNEGYCLAVGVYKARIPAEPPLSKEPAVPVQSQIDTHPPSSWEAQVIVETPVSVDLADSTVVRTLSVPPVARLPKQLYILVLLGLMAVVAVLATALRNPVPVPVDQLTDDGYTKSGPLWADGNQIYFNEGIGSDGTIASIPFPSTLSSQAVTRLKVPNIIDPGILDAREPGPEFLLSGRDDQNQHNLWAWIPNTPPRRMVRGQVIDAAWMAGDAFVTVADRRLQFFDHGVVVKTLDLSSKLSAGARDVRWSASRHVLRFVSYDVSHKHTSLWEIAGSTGAPRELIDYRHDVRLGAWGDAGRLFSFVMAGSKGSDIWLGVDRRYLFFNVSDKVMRLTQGPLDYSSPLPVPSRHMILAIGAKERAELVSYDASKGRFGRYLNGLSACELDFARDHRDDLVYVQYPERTLWRSRLDGTGAVQLTANPMEVIEPHWSPDSSQIAFLGFTPGGPEQIYLLSAKGGAPVPATSGSSSAGVPTWGPKGSMIVFGDLLQDKREPTSIHLLDVDHKTVKKLPRSDGLWTPRWSPDGNLIVALTTDHKGIKLYDYRKDKWGDLMTVDYVDSITWSADSASLYFAGKAKAIIPGQTPQRGLYRVDVRPPRITLVTDLDDFQMPSFGWFGVTPDGVPLGLRGVSSRELYAIPYPK